MENNTNSELIGLATPEQIETWKKIHSCDAIYRVRVQNHVGYIREFDRATMKCMLSLLEVKIEGDTQTSLNMNLEKIIEIGEIGLTNCWLGGSEAIKEKDKLYMSAAMQVGELFEFEEGELKKE